MNIGNILLGEETEEELASRIPNNMDLDSEINIVDTSDNNDKVNGISVNENGAQWTPELLDRFYSKLKQELNRVEEDPIQESKATERLNPVYIVTSYTGTVFGKLIRKAIHSTYTHSAISFEPTLKRIYSYGNSGTLSNSRYGGLTCESLEDYIRTNKDARILVSVVFLKDEDYNKLESYFDSFINNARNTRYDYSNLINVLKNKPLPNDPSLSSICSQFVDSLFKCIGVYIVDKPSNLVTPQDIANINHPQVYKLYEGAAIEYDRVKISTMVDKLIRYKAKAIKEQVLTEVKEFPVQFNDEGDLLISKKEKIDFLDEYNKSKKLRPSYIKYKNLEGLKYECCKLWYINTILMKLLDNKNLSYSDKEDFNNYRSKILTEFSLYLKAVQDIDKKFNFGSYYETTPFSNTKIKIKGSTIKYSISLLKKIFI